MHASTYCRSTIFVADILANLAAYCDINAINRLAILFPIAIYYRINSGLILCDRKVLYNMRFIVGSNIYYKDNKNLIYSKFDDAIYHKDRISRKFICVGNYNNNFNIIIGIDKEFEIILRYEELSIRLWNNGKYTTYTTYIDIADIAFIIRNRVRELFAT